MQLPAGSDAEPNGSDRSSNSRLVPNRSPKLLPLQALRLFDNANDQRCTSRLNPT
jgi:hypothetical protein